MTKVIIYSTPQCVYCKMAKDFFKEKNIAYEEKNVASDATARETMIQQSGQFGVPVIDVDGTIIVGFDKPRLSQLLNIH